MRSSLNTVMLYAVGSALVVEFEESCARRGIAIAAYVRNRDGPVHCSASDRLYAPANLPAELHTIPFLCPLFTPANRAYAAREAEAHGLTPAPALIDPTAVVARDLTAGPGSFINASATIGAASRIGQFVIVNRSASIGHHAHIGDFVSIGPGAVLAGEVKVGSGAMLGAGCIVLPKIVIGDHAVVSAGSVVTRNVAPGTTVRGNPAVGAGPTVRKSLPEPKHSD